MSLVGIGDRNEVHSVTRHRARIEHTCSECGCKIEPGQMYRRDFMVYCGDADTVKVCDACDQLMIKFFKAMPKEYQGEFTFELGCLRNAVVELRDEYGATIEGFQYPE